MERRVRAVQLHAEEAGSISACTEAQADFSACLLLAAAVLHALLNLMRRGSTLLVEQHSSKYKT